MLTVGGVAARLTGWGRRPARGASARAGLAGSRPAFGSPPTGQPSTGPPSTVPSPTEQPTGPSPIGRPTGPSPTGPSYTVPPPTGQPTGPSPTGQPTGPSLTGQPTGAPTGRSIGAQPCGVDAERGAGHPVLPGLLTGGTGPQWRDGVLLRQVDGTTCGPTVLTVLAAATEPGWFDTGTGGVGDRFGAAQKRVHRQANRVWPRFWGTTPFGLLAWLHRHAPAAGRYRLRWVDDTSAVDLTGAFDAVTAAVRAGRPVPMMVGTWLPRHWVLAVGDIGPGWRVYEPSSGEVRVLDPDLLRGRRAGPVLGWPRLHAVLLPELVR